MAHFLWKQKREKFSAKIEQWDPPEETFKKDRLTKDLSKY